MKVILFANTDWYLYNFRLALVKALRNLGLDIILVSPPGKYGPRLMEEGFRWIPLPMIRRSLNPFKEAKLIYALVALYRREQPDILHHFTIKPVIYGSMAARLAGIKCRINAITGMGYVFANKSRHARLLRSVVKYFFKLLLRGSFTRLIFQNPDDLDFFVENGLINAGQVRLIRGSGVNTNYFSPIDISHKDSSFKVLFATRLLWDKGVTEFVEAARILKMMGAKIEFWIAGAPDPENPSSISENQLTEWKHEELMHILGHVDNMSSLLHKVDVVVLPTIYGEGVPRILIEAAACGLPTIATNVSGCREIVDNGINGLLIDPKDSQALANAIKYFLDNPGIRQKMGERGREKVLGEFDEKIVIKKTIDVYRELLPF